MKKQLALLCVTLLFAACKDKQTTSNTVNNPFAAIQDALTQTLDSIYQQGAIVGFSVAVINKDTTLFNEGFGFSNVATKTAYTKHTIQNIGSVSKTFIGIALLKAQELGHLKLYDPINTYLPFKVVNPNHPEVPITIHQLATHTSSIRDTDLYGKSYIMLDKEHADDVMIMEYFNEPETSVSLPTYLENILSVQGNWYEPEVYADYPPGSKFDYSNVAAALAAVVLEGASRMSFKDFTKQYIFKPLNMDDTGWSNSDIDVSKRSKVYKVKDTLIADYRLITYPDGGLITSTTSLSTYFSELMKGYLGEGTILTKESYQEFYKKQLVASHFEDGELSGNTGIFLDYSTHGIGHNGGDPGIVTFMYFNPETGIGNILFVNTDFDYDDQVLETFKAAWTTLNNYQTKFK
ncbi:MAG: serine hydrolase domain-containing protein [Flavobacteriaceae bacterium]|nr:beta-lactamase family protein [Flavobacteriaceae bacterium]